MKVEPIICQLRRVADHVLGSHNGADDLREIDAELGAARAIVQAEMIRREACARDGRNALAKLVGVEPAGGAA